MSAKEQIRDWMRQVFAWDFAEKQNIVRASMARGVGLNPEQYARPYPGSVTNTVINMAPTEEPESPLPQAMTGPLGSVLGKVIGIGIPAAAAGAGLVYLGTLLSQPAQPSTPIKPVEMELRWKVVDGKIHQEVVPVEPEKK